MRNRFFLALTLPFFFAIGMGDVMAQTPTPHPDENPEGNTGALKPQIETGGSYDAHSGNATRVVNDLHVPGALGVYGLDFTRYWNSTRNDNDNPYADWPMDFGASGWSHSWKWSAVESDEIEQLGGDGGEQIYTTGITITFPDGHATKYKITRSTVVHPPQPWGPDPRCGPPYLVEHGETNWPPPGFDVHDHLGDMARDGTTFWLHRADGGSVHFTSPQGVYQGVYQATEVFDPYGLRTDLHYDTATGLLSQVQQEGGRSLTITWTSYIGVDAPVIGRVETGGPAGSQYVDYKYGRLQIGGVNFLTLIRADYQNDPAPGQIASARYTYGRCYGDVEPCSGAQSVFPLLKVADDPRVTGPMTRIRYTYRGTACEGPPPGPWSDGPYPGAKFDYTYIQRSAIAAEKSGDQAGPSGPVVVSSFTAADCFGVRSENNGIGGQRNFFFGRSAIVLTNSGYFLTKLTNFFSDNPNAAPFEQQLYHIKIWDGRNIPTEFSYLDDSGEPSEIRYVDSSSRTYDRIHPGLSDAPDTTRIHNPYGHWLFSKTDERNHTTTYTRDLRRRIRRIDYPDTSWELYTYNEFNQVLTHTLPSGAIQTYEYDGNHRLVREYNSVDRALHGPIADKVYTYDTLERVATMIEGRAAISVAPFTVQMTYNGRHRVLSVEYASTTPQYPTVRYAYDNYGNCTSITDEMGHLRTYTYDSYRRCTSYIEQLNDCGVASRRWDWIYDRVVAGVTFGASAHTSKEWRVQIEPAFNAIGERRMAARWFDVNNRITQEQTGWIQPAGEIGPNNLWYWSPDIETHYFSYDQNGQKSSYTDPLNRLTTYEYDTRNRLSKTNETINTIPRTTETHYDTTGNKTLVIFPDTKTQQWLDYDAFGQPRHFIDERSNTTDLNYWPWGPMKKLAEVITYRAKDGGGTEDQHTRFYYDLIGRPQTTLFPDMMSSEQSTYEFGQLKTWKTRRNQTKTITLYDARGRELSHTWNDGTPGITRTWDDGNRLITLANSVSTIDYSYDDAGQMLTEGSTVAGSDGITGNGVREQLSCCRYPSGEVSQMTYPNGSTVQRTYTARGQLQSVSWNGGSGSYTYLSDGKVNQQNYLNGVTTAFVYNGRGMIGSLRHTNNASGHDLASRAYWRDERDRITAWTRGIDRYHNGMEDGRGDRYDYDEEGQLTQASYRALTPEATPSGAMRADTFHYDALGNRMGTDNYVASRGAVNFSRRDNGLNQYVSWTPSVIYYDDNIPAPSPSPSPPWAWIPPGNGVLMQDGWITASFNALNQPVAMWSPMYPNGQSAQFMWFGYDPLGRCVKRWMGLASGGAAGSNPATYFYYDGWNLVQEGTSANIPTRLYVHGGRVDEIVASQVGGQWYYHHYDARGHCILLTNTNGSLQEQYDYDAFGFPYYYTPTGARLGSLAAHTRFLFTGREWLGDLRIYDFRNRQYQPELGRFLQPDPKEFGAGDYNLYRYCHNDPINKSDPLGLLEITLEEYKRIPFSNLKELVQTKFEVFNSFVDAGKAGGKAAGPAALADHSERYGGVGRVSNTRLYIYGHPIKGTHDKVQNYSALRTAPLPNGVERVGGYWVLGRHQDAHSWPVNRFNGKSDGQVLRESHFSAVMTNPPSPGANSLNNQYSYKSYDADSDKEGN